MEGIPVAAVLGVVASVAFFVVGFSVQDWGGPVGDPTGGKRDGTWGTWSTDYALGVQCLVYGMTAPGGTGATSARVGFLVEGLGWAGAGIMHQFFYQPSSTHDVLWMTSLVLGVFAGPLKAGGVAVMAAAKDDSSSKRRAATIGRYATFGLCAAFLVGLAESGVIPLPGWTVALFTKSSAMLSIVISGCGATAPAEAAMVAATFALAIGINVIKPQPFLWSPDFNDNGLFHSAGMLYLAATLVLLGRLTRAGQVGNKDELEELMRRKAEIETAISEFDAPETDEVGLLCCSACTGPSPRR